MDLCDWLGVRRPEALGIIHLLWHWAARHSPLEGKVTIDREKLAKALFWTGEPDLLWRALIHCEWMDEWPNGDVYVHEWKLYGGADEAIEKKRTYDRERLRMLRQQEQLSLEPPTPTTLSVTPAGDEVMRVYATLKGDSPALPNDLKRIERTIEKYPKQDPYDVALSYVAWQIKVAEQWREFQRGLKPHTDVVAGWMNQMRMHHERGWSLRDGHKKSRGDTIKLTPDDLARYHSDNTAQRELLNAAH